MSPVQNDYLKIDIPDDLSWEQFKELHTQVVIPAKTPTPDVFDYDVALSFAGEIENMSTGLRKYYSPIPL